MGTDLISNTVAISLANPVYPPQRDGTVDFSKQWGHAISAGILKEDLIWPIMHELTHHGSLDSVIGVSMGALAVSHTNISNWHILDKRILDPARDIFRFSLLNTFFKPLLEGLALFCELDATSDNVPYATFVSQLSAALFYKPETRDAVLSGKDSLHVLKDKLQIHRQSDSIQSKKYELLSSSVLDRDTYLIGYLLVKSVWCDLTVRNSTWNNSDLFLLFAMDYFFGDYDLAARVLTPSQLSPEDEMIYLDAYMHNRLISFCKESQTNGAQFLRSLQLQKSDEWHPDYHNYNDTLKQAIEEGVTIRTTRKIYIDTPDFLTVRHIPRFLCTPGKANIDEDGKFTFEFDDGAPTIHGPAMDEGKPIDGKSVSGPGSVEAVVLYPRRENENPALLLCIFLDLELIATYDLRTGEFNNKKHAKACERMGSYLSLESFAALVEDELVMPDCEEANLVNALNGEMGYQKTMDLWAKIALVPEPNEADKPDSYKLLIQRGFQDALSFSQFEMIELSRISLLPIGSKLSESDLRWIDRFNKRSLAVLGFNLIRVKDDKLIASRV